MAQVHPDPAGGSSWENSVMGDLREIIKRDMGLSNNVSKNMISTDTSDSLSLLKTGLLKPDRNNAIIASAEHGFLALAWSLVLVAPFLSQRNSDKMAKYQEGHAYAKSQGKKIFSKEYQEVMAEFDFATEAEKSSSFELRQQGMDELILRTSADSQKALSAERGGPVSSNSMSACFCGQDYQQQWLTEWSQDGAYMGECVFGCRLDPPVSYILFFQGLRPL
jgi:hypothetical protein